MLNRAEDYSHLEDNDPEAPWNRDADYAGPKDRTAMRRSWEAAQARASLRVVDDDKAAYGDAPPPRSLADYGLPEEGTREPDGVETSGSSTVLTGLPPLTIADWLARDLEAPDCLMGEWLTTTSRALLVAPTGLGKTNFAMALAIAVAAGADFLHWHGKRTARVLYIDGEMSRRLYRQRIVDAATRLRQRPAAFYALSREDLEDMPPLNTPAGQACIEGIVKAIGGVDLIVFDSIMCLLGGDPKENEPWAAVMPWVRSLTRRGIGQLWVHHTGIDKSRGYGDSTREWQLDTVLHMEGVDHPETDVAFNLEFTKARERTPDNRADFQTRKVMLLADAWSTDGHASEHKGHVSPLGLKFYGALTDALAGDDDATTISGRRATTLAKWKGECTRLGIIDRDAKRKSADALFSKHKRELIAANYIACNDERVWTL